MRKFIISLLGIFAFASLTGCATDNQQNQNPTETNTPKVVKIGAILPLSGPGSNYGKDATNVYNYVVDNFNASQSDLSIELVIEDGQCDGKSSTSAAQKLVNIDKVQAIVGGFCSAETIAAGKIAQQAGVVMLSPVSDATEISNIGEYVFRFYTNIDASKALAEHIRMQSPEKLVIVAENSDASVGFANDLVQFFPIEQVDMTTYQSSEKDMVMLAKQIKEKLSAQDYLVLPFASDVTSESVIKAFDKEGILELL
ncbi:MAG: ABC transporter substrate-binding protein [Candidatus Peribacteria bacterium]|jgi:branched-chain amino acid transport system substrate-binding protein|nr:ABC transporter substrate-binding protein [Candidatus Peribacteria bacterium]